MTRRRHIRRSSTSIETFLASFPDEEACLAYVFYTRHGFDPRCPKCSLPAKFKLAAYRRSFVSRCCGAFRSPTAGTILNHTQVPLRMWFYAMLLYSDLSTGISQNALRRQLGITRKAAWALADKIRTHIALSLPAGPLGGDGRKVYIDETRLWIGPQQECLIILGLTDGERCLLRIVSDRSAQTLVPAVLNAVRQGSTIVSDGWPAYNQLGELGFSQSRVVHLRKMWVNAAGDSTTYVEGLWSVTKRLLRGKSAQVLPDNLWKFLAEIMHRYNGGLDPAAAYWSLLGSFRPVSEADLEATRRRIDLRQ